LRIEAVEGQSSVEAAALLPVIMLLVALLVQPVCAFYTLTVMRHAAAETVRVLATTDEEEVARSFALRRLRAVPESALFHSGGDGDWCVRVQKEGGATAGVEVSGHVTPLPLFGVVVEGMGPHDDRGVLLVASVIESVRPEWVSGDYADWIGEW
jgi:hypothetical protein